MVSWVLDASALLAMLNGEPGEQVVARAIRESAAMSAVNMSEVVAKLSEVGMPETEIRESLEPLGLTVFDFDEDSAYAAGLLRTATREAGLSLGDRACLSLAQHLGLTVLTVDRSWDGLRLQLTVQIIR